MLGKFKLRCRESRIHIPVPFIAAWMFTCIIACMPHLAAAQTGGVIPLAGADGAWKANVILRNVSTSTVTQKVGHLTYTRAGFDPIVIEPTVTLEPGETMRIPNAGANYDSGFWIQAIDNRLECSVSLSYGSESGGPGSTNFEVNAVSKPLMHVGDAWEYHSIVTDATPATASGAWAVVMNTAPGGVTPLVFRVFGSKKVSGGYEFKDEFYAAPAGITLYPIQTARPAGATVLTCLSSCSAGAPGTTAPVYVFILTGRDGAVRTPRYPMAPGS